MDITQEHPEYRAAQTVLNKYWDLYIGGDHLRARSHLYLEQRQKEPLDVYSERLAKVFYENYIGSIIDWYALFVEDCDQRGSSLTAFLRRLYIQAMVYGQSYALIDMPRCTGKLTSRGEEDREGVSRAYLVDYSPANLINWSRDSQGAFE